MPRSPGTDSPNLAAASAPAPPAGLEAIVTRLAPLYRERTALQSEQLKISSRLEKLSREIAELESQLRNPGLH